MLMFPGMIADAAVKAGMKVPENPDDETSWMQEDYPHFRVFCTVQLCRRIRWGEHWGNAEVVAAIPDSEIRTITLQDLIDRGLEFYE
jgi:hypothetical protein